MSRETDLIKEKIDVAAVVGEYVTLKQLGGHFKGLCPFHQEKTASFIVSPEKGIWHCFGCGEGGDVFSFIQKIEGLDFVGALKLLAERAGVELRSEPKEGSEYRDRRTRLYDLLSLTAKFYHEILMNQPAGAKAKKYLLERGLTEQTMKRFMVGYALQNWDSLQKFLARKGYQLDDMIAAGLVGRTDRGKTFDRFRGRIMFPVQDVQDRVIAFGGRITPWHATGEEGKYVNSPETELYEKRKVVYNLNRAKKVLRRHEPCLIVEGYMDIAMLVQIGIENVVATSGTAFTAEHIQHLKRYTDVLHFAFDGDSAGLKAAQAATQEAVAAGLRVATVLFPNGQDPADVAKDNPEQARECVQKPIPLVSVLLRRLEEANDPQERESLLKSILPFIRSITNVVQQGEMIQTLARTLHVPETTIHEELSKIPRGPAQVSAPQSATAEYVLGPEQLLLGIVISNPAVRAEIFNFIDPDFFVTSTGLEILEELKRLTIRPDFAQLSADGLLAALPEHRLHIAEAMRRLAEEELSHSSHSPTQEARLLLRTLTKKTLQKRLDDLQRKLSENGLTERQESLKEFQALAERLASVEADR